MDTVQLLGQIPDGKMPLLPKLNTQEKYGAITVRLVFVLMLIRDPPMKKMIFFCPMLDATETLASLRLFYPVFFT